jgi:antitoxin component of MazEF toxin-antitoxin module
MKAFVKAKRIGGSIMVRVPKEIVDAQSINEGTLVEIDVNRPRRDFFGALKGLKMRKEDELDTHG